MPPRMLPALCLVMLPIGTRYPNLTEFETSRDARVSSPQEPTTDDIQILEPTLLSLTAIVVLGALAAYGGEAPPAALPAAPSGARIERTSWGGWSDAYRLTNGTIEVVVVPASGRILHYGYTGAANLLWQNASAVGGLPWRPGTWTNYGGSKTWIWPQEDWPARTGSGWPPPTDLPATIVNTVEIRDKGTLRLTSPGPAGLRRRHRPRHPHRRLRHPSLHHQPPAEDGRGRHLRHGTVDGDADASATAHLFARLLPGSRLPERLRGPSRRLLQVGVSRGNGTSWCRATARQTSAKIGMDADLLAWQRGRASLRRAVGERDETPLSARSPSATGASSTPIPTAIRLSRPASPTSRWS